MIDDVNALPVDQKARFDQAVGIFRDSGPIRVPVEKLQCFLQTTSDFDMSPAQRLRWLAVALESHEFEQGWAGLRAIYRAAADANPLDTLVLHSWAISAINWVEGWMTPGQSDRTAIADEAQQVLQQALILHPQESRIAYTLGSVFYNHPARSSDPEWFRTQALTWFTRAAQWDPHNAIAKLYVAHCFHDRKDWPSAITAYEAVDLDQLDRHWPAWRAVKCREQLALCIAHVGNKDESTRRFRAFLDDVESWDDANLEERVINVNELVFATTNFLSDSELLRRTRALVKQLGSQQWYPELESSAD